MNDKCWNVDAEPKEKRCWVFFFCNRSNERFLLKVEQASEKAKPYLEHHHNFLELFLYLHAHRRLNKKNCICKIAKWQEGARARFKLAEKSENRKENLIEKKNLWSSEFKEKKLNLFLRNELQLFLRTSSLISSRIKFKKKKLF